jgi:hypothetical protein
LRVGRQWRNLKERKWFGFGHTQQEPQAAEMALFCPACPQPNINLAPEWMKDPREWLYWRGLVADGNFVAVHQVQPRSLDDVWLKDGQSFMTGTHRYRQHLECTIERAEVHLILLVFRSNLTPIISLLLAMNTAQSWTNQNVTKDVMFLESGRLLVCVMAVMHRDPLSISRKAKGR